MNKQLFVMAFCMVGGSLQAMGLRIISQEKVSLVIGEEQDTVEIQIPLRYARLSKTLQGSLDNCNDEKPTVTVPLPRKAGVFVVEQLEPLYQYSYQDQREALDSVKDAVSKLDGTTLVLVLRALEYLDIQVLPKIVYEELLKRSPAWIASYCVKLLPRTIRCAVLRHQVAHFLDLKYDDVPVAASRDDEEPNYETRIPLIIGDHEVCRGHKELLSSVCVTGDNKIVSGSYDNTIRVFDMRGNELTVFRGHEGGINSLCIAGDNKIVSGSAYNTVRVWDMQGNELAVCRGHEGPVYSVCVTEDNKIVSGSYDNTVRVWDMQGNELVVCRGHEGPVYSVCVTGDNKIVSCSWDNTARVFDMQGNELAVCRGHEGSVDYVYVTKDNKIVSGSRDNTVRVFDIQGNHLLVCRGPEGAGYYVCVTANNKIVLGSLDNTVRVFDMQGNELAVCRGHKNYVATLWVTADNKIVSGSYDNTVRVWDMQGNELAVFWGHEGEVTSLCVTAYNKIVSSSWDHTVRIWDADKLVVLEKAISDVGNCVEKSRAIWELIQKYYAGTEDTQGFCNELKALIA